MERLPLPLGHLGPALAPCPWHALGEPLFQCRSVIACSLQQNEEMSLALTPLLLHLNTRALHGQANRTAFVPSSMGLTGTPPCGTYLSGRFAWSCGVWSGPQRTGVELCCFTAVEHQVQLLSWSLGLRGRCSCKEQWPRMMLMGVIFFNPASGWFYL